MKRILVATDLSPCATNALARAIRLAAKDGAAIRIVHAAPESEEPEACSSTQRRMLTEARIMAEELAGRPLDISVRISSASPSQAILHEAEAFDADLIVLGTHGEPRFRDALFGTTGTHVVRHSERPVLVVQSDNAIPYSKVLVAIADAEYAPPILAATLDVAPASEVFALHAFYPSLRETLGGQDELNRQEARRALELEKLLGAAQAGRGAARLTADTHAIVETGEALSVVMKETEALKPDLLAMGTRRRATYLGSHAVDTLFWCPHDVLVVPERESVTPEATVSA